ncbi:hypothetical protein ES705_41953 [subsurface metagenome]
MRLRINFNNLKWITDYYKNFRLRQRGKGLKTCSKCGEVRGIGDFFKNRRYKDGLSSVCRACQSAYNRERYLVHREEVLKQVRVWRAKNKEKIRVYQKDYQNENKDRLRPLAKEYYKRHRTRIIEQNKKYYEDHKEACQARKKLWRLKNEEKVRRYNKEYKLEHKSASF